MTMHKRLFVVTAMVSIIYILNISDAYSMQKQSRQQPTQQDEQDEQEEHVSEQEMLVGIKPVIRLAQDLFQNTQRIIQGLNESLALAHSSNKKSIKAVQASEQALANATHASEIASKVESGIEQAQSLQANAEQQIQTATENLEQKYEQLSAALNQEAAEAEKRLADTVRKDIGLSVEDKIKIAQATEKIKNNLGIYEQDAKIQAQANVDGKVGAEKEKWKNVREIIGDSKPLIKIALAIIATTVCIYAIKYGMPALMNYFTRPRVISETSKTGWFTTEWFTTEWFGLKSKQNNDIDDLVFTPSLQKQLFDLLLRVQSAKKYDEALPNILFYGASGTGKTAFVRTLAYTSGLDYALTSGSEFAKITDLNEANNELRKLLNWAKKSAKGLIIFIDEAESLFANRKLPSTSKATQDFVNTFLALISDQSQKNVMFIFATNNPSKLDDAITNRIGMNIEFTLPQAPEREKILLMYLAKFAQENEDAMVDFHPEIRRLLSNYAALLEGFSPRAIKFVAEEMVIKARRQESKLLTNEIAREVIDETKHSLQQTIEWEKERNEWTRDLTIPQMSFRGWFS